MASQAKGRRALMRGLPSLSRRRTSMRYFCGRDGGQFN